MKTKEELKKENDENKVINDNFKVVSDDKLLNELNNINIDSLMQSTVNNRSLWKLSEDKDNHKTERRQLRKEQLNLSKYFLLQLKEKNAEEIKKSKEALLNFSNKNLIDIKNYSNVSKKENAEVRSILDLAYNYLNK